LTVVDESWRKMLKVITLNLWRDEYLKKERLDLTIKAVKEANADIVTLQEVTSMLEYGYPTTAHYIASRTGLEVVIFNDPQSEEIGTAILSKLPCVSSRPVVLSERNGKAVFAELMHPQRNILIATAHLSWGSQVEGERFREAVVLDGLFSNEISADTGKRAGEAIGLLTGDFNALPDSPTINYLRGKMLVEGKNTLWVDSWETKLEPGYTSTLTNNNSEITARSSGLNPKLTMPERRIDYVFSYGYAYGRAGSFHSSELFGNIPTAGLYPSDHLGIITEINL